MKVTINNKSVNVPDNWNDIPSRKLSKIIRIFYSDGNDLKTKKIEMLSILLNLPLLFFESWEKDAGEYFTAELSDLLQCTEFLFEEVKDKYFAPSLQLTKTPWNKLNIADDVYHGPNSSLSNISFYEWCKADSYFINYHETKKKRYLNKLIATLYRPSKPNTEENKATNFNGDVRLPLQGYESTLNKRAWMISQLPLVNRLTILHFFSSCRKEITDTFENIFPKPKDDEVPEKRGGNDYGWAGVILELAGTKFGDDAAVSSKPLFTILVHLSMQEDKRKLAAMNRAKQKT